MAKQITSGTILVIDDDRSIRRTLKEILEYEGYKVEEAEDGMDGMVKIKTNNYDAILCDIKMARMDGLEVLDNAVKLKPDLPLIMISGHGTMETAVQAVKKGAYDFIAKPLDLNRLLITVRNALDRSDLAAQAKQYKQRATRINEIIGQSAAIKRITDTIDRVAPTDARILITGDNGSGKELVARWVHEKSNRAEGPFVEVNCAAIPSELIESELFGHEKGSFTSAIKQRIGKFEQANGGTLFLDEIGDMSPSAQAKVLRVLQENKLTRVGGDRDITVNVRVLSATNKNLLEEVGKNNFRLDLYHRVNVIQIHVPSLNDRREDIPLLAKHFINDICSEQNDKPKNITQDALNQLQNMKWTGNVRELRNIMERLIILSDQEITLNDVLTYGNPSGNITSGFDFDAFTSFQDFKDATEKQFLEFKLRKHNWNISKVADEIDIQRSHLYTKIEKYNLQKND